MDAIRPLVATTRRPGADADLGGFGGVFDLAAAGYADPLLVAATDGVGTKLKIAVETGRHGGVGIDLVAMCVNDLVVQGAEPLFFLDYLATGRLAPDAAVEVVEGIVEGCRRAGCALIGGETAEMPGMYADDHYDLAGFAVGAVERGALLTGADIVIGDVVLGLASDGFHSNGFSLIRRLVADHGLAWTDAAPFAAGATLGEALLRPTRIYVAGCLRAARAGHLKGLAHITGGGLLENIPRVIPAGLGVTLEAGAWPLPASVAWVAGLGHIAPDELARTFNCGIGMAAIVAPDRASEAKAVLAEAGETVHEIGRVAALGAGGARVVIEGIEELWRT